MSDKRYPTRLHEVLGVEPEEWFTYSEYGDRRFWLSESGLLYGAYDDGKVMSAVTQGTLVLFINNPERIVRRPRLTEEQILALNAAVKWFGLKWLVKDKCESVCFWQNKPEKRENHWSAYGGGMYADIMTVKVDNLVSWSDPEPLDIVQVLRENGVEVEVE